MTLKSTILFLENVTAFANKIVTTISFYNVSRTKE